VGRAPGLIGLYPQTRLAGTSSRVLRPRLVAYGVLFLVASVALAASLLLRTPFESNVLRPRGANPFVLDGELVRNVFEIHLVNKGPATARFRITVVSPVEAEIAVTRPEVELASLGDTRVPISVAIERERLHGPLELTVRVDELGTAETRSMPVPFLAPFSPPSSH
jgi:polyferredoxin